MEQLQIKIKYFDKEMPKLEKTSIGDWIDVRVCGVNNKTTGEKCYEDVITYKKGDFLMLDLGIATQVPQGYETNLVPRSSTFKNYGFIQTNHFGVIDESYCGDGDKQFMPVYCTRDGLIEKYDRVGQFRLNKKMPQVIFEEVEVLGNDDRGGHGSSGVK